MNRYVLAGDVGGTRTLLAIYKVNQSGKLILVREGRFVSKAYDRLETIVRNFLREGGELIEASVFGLPGPVLDGEAPVTNLPWRVSTTDLTQATGCFRIRMMNDRETTAYGSLFLSPKDILTLNPGKPRHGNRAVIAAGAELGEAFLFWDGTRHRPAATEGGHVEFAPRTEQEIALLAFLGQRYDRVSYERVLAGPGLVNIFEFLRDVQQKPVAQEVLARFQQDDPATVIGESGVSGVCATCEEAVDIFLSVYGARAGNFALTVMATGGVYIGGGILMKLMPRLSPSNFVKSFLDKGRCSALMTEIPLRVILNPQTSHLGAAYVAKELLERET
jgi:glucokinase